MNLKSLINYIIKAKDPRTALIKKNIIFSFLIKGWSGLVQLLLIPATIYCLGSYKNGIWMTISSVLVWIDSMDIGLGNGLRNQLAKDVAHKNWKAARTSVSTTFIMLTAIIIPIAVAAILIVNSINTYAIFNVERSIIDNLNEILTISISTICATFIFKFIGNVYMGLQMPAVNNALVVCGQTLALIAIYLFKYFNIHSLLYVSLAYTFSPLLVYLAAYPVTFILRFPQLRPTVNYFNLAAAKSLILNGLNFFIIQIAGIVLFASSNLLISHFFNPIYVTPYQVAYRYYSFMVIFFTIVVTPFWSATTDAFEHNDYSWIRQSIKKIHRILFLVMLILLIMTLSSNFIYRLWVGNDIKIPYQMSILMAIYIYVILHSMSYSYILNGLGCLRLQIICTVTAAILFIPTAWALCKFFQINGIIISLILLNLPGLFINGVQLYKIINKKATGIWKIQ